MGLQPTPELEHALMAGPYHPAFGELVLARLMLRRTRQLLAGAGESGPVTLVVNGRDLSIFHGQRGANLQRLRQLGLEKRFILHTDPDQPRLTVRMLPATNHLLGERCR